MSPNTRHAATDATARPTLTPADTGHRAPPRRDWQAQLANWAYAQTVMDRLIANLRQDGSCWVWTRSTNGDGYGLISIKRAMIRTHQVSYQLFVGSVPDGLQLDHLCRVRLCVNPDHLEPVTSGENTRRGTASQYLPDRSKWTHCKNGHAFTAGNTYTHPKTGYRTCRRCRADRQKEYDAARSFR
ncbi:HNH endonuclease signature motif containing protein [Streptomyces sp. NPDC052535]|uniref:HNH endonuclease signature motif containing protein n=1 Tax=Streptomyces sp. NPDC052535 TaxID=3155531 RepID=UPI00342A0ABD